MGGGAGIGGFGSAANSSGAPQQGGFSGMFGNSGQQNPSSGVGGFGRPQGGFNNRQGGFGQQAGFNGFNPQPQFQNPYGPPQMQQMYSPYSQMDQNQFGFQQPQAFRDYQQQQQARMFQNPYQQNPYQQPFQNPYQQNPYRQNPYRQNPFDLPAPTPAVMTQRYGQQQQLPQQTQAPPNAGAGEIRTAVMPQPGTPEFDQRFGVAEEFSPEARAQQQFENMSQADRMRAASDDSGMGRGMGNVGLDQMAIFTPDHYQQQPRGMTMDMPRPYGRDPFQSMGGLGSLGNLFNRYGTQRGQQTAPPGMERRVGWNGEYFVPAGTPYNPFAD